MLKSIVAIILVVVLSLMVATPVLAGGPPPRDSDGERVRVVVYVESQELYYDSIVGPNLPPHGKFQQLIPNGDPTGLYPATEYGPGDPGYRGGRWWVDANNSGEMDDGDVYFSCPLLGKGHTSPNPPE